MATKKTNKKIVAKKAETKNTEITLIDPGIVKELAEAVKLIDGVLAHLTRFPAASNIVRRLGHAFDVVDKMADTAVIDGINKRIERASGKESRKANLVAKKKAQLEKLQAELDKLQS